MSRIRNPDDKKLRSYRSDCRNVVAESGSSARKAVAKRKAGASQALRKAVHDRLVGLSATEGVEDFDLSVERVGRKSFRKTPDVPLADALQRKLDDPGRFKSTKASDSGRLASARAKLGRKRGG